MKNMHYNFAKITGTLLDGLTYSHASEKMVYFKGMLAVKRTSGKFDYLRVVVNERAAAGLPDLTDKTISVTGQISTCNRTIDGKSRLLVELFAHHIDVMESGEHANSVMLRGVVCKPPVFRVTPGGREICDVMLAVNRLNGRSSYIPCIAWGADARNVRDVPMGELLEVHGRFQSRDYEKRHEDGTVESRSAYEISAAKVVTEAE